MTVDYWSHFSLYIVGTIFVMRYVSGSNAINNSNGLIFFVKWRGASVIRLGQEVAESDGHLVKKHPNGWSSLLLTEKNIHGLGRIQTQVL